MSSARPGAGCSCNCGIVEKREAVHLRVCRTVVGWGVTHQAWGSFYCCVLETVLSAVVGSVNR
jgi:hypothetical protein